MAKADKTYKVLHKWITGLPQGVRLPSVRSLMKTHGVSQVTLDSALKQLKQEGLIVAQVGKGMYTGAPVDKPGVQSKRIALIAHDFPSPFNDALLLAVRHTLCEKFPNIQELRYHWKARLNSTLRGGAWDAAIIIPNHDTFHTSDLQSCERQGYPVIMLDTQIKMGAINTVCTDNRFGGALAARHLIELGHRRLAVFVSESEKVDAIHDRLHGFLNFVSLSGEAEAEVIYSKMPKNTDRLAASYKAMKKALFSAPSWTGLFIINSSCVLPVYKALSESGRSVPDDISVVGYDAIPEIPYLNVPLTHIRQKTELWAKKIVDILTAGFSSEKFEAASFLIQPELVLMNSTAQR